jgi:methionyl-tRNA formyltransferase
MRVIFLGTPEFAVPSLQALIQSPHEVCAVFTQPDRPAGRGQKPQPPPVKSFAIGAGIAVFQPEKIRVLENRPVLESYQPDFIVVVAYGQILPAWLLELPRLGCVNVHGSLLPRYRGAAPIAWAIINGDTITGITTMLMDEHLDTGPMLLTQEVPIAGSMTSGQLTDKMAQVGAELLIPTLAGLQNGSVKPVAQDDALATLAPRITKDMARISWDRDARGIHNLIRGLNPWPLAFSECLGNRIQIIQSLPPDNAPAISGQPGTYLGVTGKGLRVACGAGSVLEILELQPAGKKRVTGRDFANGARLTPGQLIFS